MGDRENMPRRNWVHKHSEEINRPQTHLDKTKNKRPKYVRPVHEIDWEDEYIDEKEIWDD